MVPAAGMQVDPVVAEALAVVLRSSRPSRFRVLTVACPNDHVLARVYRTALGLVVVHETDGVKKARSHDLPGYGPVQLPPIRGPRAETNAYLVDDPLDDVWPMTCRCSSHTPRAWELLDAVASGRKRFRVAE
ncbi:MAG: hypothetical protein Q8R60_08835 [Mycobacteriales bacterium]|nr:hypothetical protein [Mycobacteriales bacterium]